MLPSAIDKGGWPMVRKVTGEMQLSNATQFGKENHDYHARFVPHRLFHFVALQ